MPCGNDPSGRIGRGCRSGMSRLAAWVRPTFGVGSLGCFNPASRAGGVPSLHADGRAEDAAVDAHRDFARGWRLFTWLIANADAIELQETLFAGYLWSCRNRHLGIRGPGIQQAAHMNHVHYGVSYRCADNFTTAWLGGGAAPAPPRPRRHPMGKMYEASITMGRIVVGSVWHIAPGYQRWIKDPKDVKTLQDEGVEYLPKVHPWRIIAIGLANRAREVL